MKLKDKSTRVDVLLCILLLISFWDLVWPQEFDFANQKLTNKDEVSELNTTISETRSTCKCGLSLYQAHRIIGGSPAQLHSIPWRCALFYEDRKTKTLKFYCGCSIIDRSWAMTAAHCTHPFDKKKTKFFVDVGDHDLSTVNETRNRVIPVISVKQHPKYNRVTALNNDISLLQLSDPVVEGDNAVRVCLPFKFQNKSFIDKTVTASGWGVTKEGTRLRPSVLQTVDLKVLSDKQCKRYYGNKVNENMICTYSKGKDACQGDSGSSIDFHDVETRRYYALGVFELNVNNRENSEIFRYLLARVVDDYIQEYLRDSRKCSHGSKRMRLEQIFVKIKRICMEEVRVCSVFMKPFHAVKMVKSSKQNANLVHCSIGRNMELILGICKLIHLLNITHYKVEMDSQNVP